VIALAVINPFFTCKDDGPVSLLPHGKRWAALTVFINHSAVNVSLSVSRPQILMRFVILVASENRTGNKVEFLKLADKFWDDLKRINPHMLLAVRSRKFLRWHFRYAMLGSRVWIATLADGSRLIAYAIFSKTCNAETGIKQVKLVDYQALDGSPDMLGPFMPRALKRCRSEDIHILEHTGRWLEKGESFESAAPYRRKLPSWQYFYRINNPGLRAALSENVWGPSLFDGDATL
jgi:hypothetical protein